MVFDFDNRPSEQDDDDDDEQTVLPQTWDENTVCLSSGNGTTVG